MQRFHFWTNYEVLNVAGLKVVRENRSFRIYDAQAGAPVHSHQVPTVAIVVSGEAMAEDKHLDHPASRLSSRLVRNTRSSRKATRG